MKHCQECDLDFPVSYKFCGSCGGGLPDSHTCGNCGELVDSKWAFCTGCGKSLSPNATAGPRDLPVVPEPLSVVAPTSVRQQDNVTAQTGAVDVAPESLKHASHAEWYAAPELFEETTEITIASPAVHHSMPNVAELPLVTQSKNGKAAPTLTMLSAYGQPESIEQPNNRGRQILAVGLLLLVFVAVGFGSVYWFTHRASAAQVQIKTQETIAPVTTASSASKSTSTSTSEPTKPTISADEEWKRLREKRIAAKSSEGAELINSLHQAEQTYPRDYRFPYERAKLSIKGITSHHDAFEALSAAADKAVDNGKAQEMLDNLRADKDGDFWKLARGHHEWQTLVQALGSEDKSSLSELRH